MHQELPDRRTSIAQELILPSLLFIAIGGMVWAVRGCSGYGGPDGCTFAGITFAAAWHFLSREPRTERSRRYSSGWVLLALTLGMGFSGNRGWMQWPSWFEGKLCINYATQRYAAIDPINGWIWQFIAGMPWAGLGAVCVAWCGSRTRVSLAGWLGRFALGAAGFAIASWVFHAFPKVFLPLYDQLDYWNWKDGPNLKRTINDNQEALRHLGLYLGFLSFEALRRDWRNVALILIVGTVNGIGWASLQNWHWAKDVWPDAGFNFWRCWESSAGLSIGLAYGLAFFACNRPLRSKEGGKPVVAISIPPNLERIGMVLGLTLGLGWSIRCGAKGWANIYVGDEDFWALVATWVFVLAGLIVLWLTAYSVLQGPFTRDFTGDSFPRYTAVFWGVLLCQNALAQLITPARANWSEASFAIYYILLFLVTAVVTYSVSTLRSNGLAPGTA